MSGMKNIALSEIKIGTRERPVNEAYVESVLAPRFESAAAHMQPVIVRPIEDKTYAYELVDGAHRLRAATINGWQAIPAEIIDVDAQTAKFHEVNMNLFRAHLTALAYGEGLLRLQEIAEASGKKTGRGRPKKNSDNLSELTFIQNIEELTDKSGRNNRRYLEAVKGIPAKQRKRLHGTSHDDNLSTLLLIKAYSTQPEIQARIVQLLAEGKDKIKFATAEAQALAEAGEAPEVEVKKSYADTLAVKLDKMNKVERRITLSRVVSEYHDELIDLLREAGAI